MNTIRKTRLIVLIALLIPELSVAVDDSLAIKQKLKQYSFIEFKNIQRKRGNFNPSALYTKLTIKEQKAIHNQRFDEIEKQLVLLQSFIDTTPVAQLPDALFLRFLNDNKALYEFPKLGHYILSIDHQIMLPVFGKYYSQSDVEKRHKILTLLEVMASRKALPLVKKALDDPDLSVRSQAQKVLFSIWRLKEKPKLKDFLIATKNAWQLKPTVRDYSLIGNKSWYEKFFVLVNEGKVPLNSLDFLGDINDCPEEVIGDNLHFLIKIITANNPNSSFYHKDSSSRLKQFVDQNTRESVDIVQKLLLQIKHPKYIKKLSPLLTTLLHDRYWGGRTTTGNFRKPPQPYNHLRFKEIESNRLLNKISSTLNAKDIELWQNQISYDFLTDLFLQSLFTQKSGITLKPYDKKILLRITVINRDNNETLASSDYLLNNSEKTRIVLPSKSHYYSNKKMTINVHLDREKWMFHASIDIDFKPHGVSFNAYIPLAGIHEISFTKPDTVKGEKHKDVWIFEHIYQPY